MVRVGDDLAAFLAARLDEDEQWAEDLIAYDRGDVSGMYGIAQRMLREVAAGRTILEMYTSTLALVEHPPVMEEGHPHAGKISARDYMDAKRELAVLKPAVMAIAAIWSDRPDYRQEWKP